MRPFRCHSHRDRPITDVDFAESRRSAPPCDDACGETQQLLVSVARGDEIGIFRLGSTAVVFFEPKANVTWLAKDGPVRFGQPFARHEDDG